MSTVSRYKENEIIKELALEHDLDKRVIEYIIKTENKFVADRIKSKYDERAIRLPYLGVFAMKNSKTKEGKLDKDIILEAGFHLVNDDGDMQHYRTSIYVANDGEDWYELTVDLDTNEVILMHWRHVFNENASSEDGEYVFDSTKTSETVFSDIVKDADELKAILKEYVNQL